MRVTNHSMLIRSNLNLFLFIQVTTIKDFSSTDSLVKSKLKLSQSFHSETDLAKKKLNESFIHIKTANTPVELKTFKSGVQSSPAQKPNAVVAPPPVPPPPVPLTLPVRIESQEKASAYVASNQNSQPDESTTLTKVPSFRFDTFI